MGQPQPLFRLFSNLFKQALHFLQQIYVKKWCRDSNPRPLERESLPITTRPGLPPLYITFFTFLILFKEKRETSSSLEEVIIDLPITHCADDEACSIFI